MAGWLRVSTGNSSSAGATRKKANATRLTRPGTTTALPAASPSIPASATLSAGTHVTRGRADSATSLEKPAVSLHSPSEVWASTASRFIDSRSMSGVVDRALSRRGLSVSAVQS